MPIIRKPISKPKPKPSTKGSSVMDNYNYNKRTGGNYVGAAQAAAAAAQAAAKRKAEQAAIFKREQDDAALRKYLADLASATARASSSGGGGGGGGGGGITKQDDKPQVKALKEMLNKSFAKQKDIKIGNIRSAYDSGRADLLKGYTSRANMLLGSQRDNEKSEADASFANKINQVREFAETQENAALQGAGESDTLKSQLMSIRNMDANQQEVNRSFFDTQRSVNSAMVDLEGDTRTSQLNMYNQRNNDFSQVYNDYYAQRVDAWTQIGNINANPYSNMKGKNKKAYDYAAKNAGLAWKAPKAPTSITNWKGSAQPSNKKLNNSILAPQTTDLSAPAPKKPEGASLREW